MVAAILATIAAAAIKEQLVYVDDADAAVDYWTPSGTWNVGTGSGLYQNSFTFSDVEGATITWRFRGALRIVASRSRASSHSVYRHTCRLLGRRKRVRFCSLWAR